MHAHENAATPEHQARGDHLCSFVQLNDPCMQYISFHWLLVAIILFIRLTLKDADVHD